MSEPTPHFDDFTSQIDTASEITLLVTVGVLVLGSISHLARVKHFENRSDPGNVLHFIKFVRAVADKVTDCLFSVLLYLHFNQGKGLLISFCFTTSVVTLLFPWILSIIASLYFTTKWNRWQYMNPTRLTIFMKKYKILFNGASFVADFYTTLDLFRSKLLCLSMFFLPLTQHEYIEASKLKFIIVLILENIPQLIIQFIYLLKFSSDSSQLTAYVSLVFTVSGVFIAIIGNCANLLQYIYPTHDRYLNKTIMNIGIAIKSTKLKKIHAICHNKMKQIFDDWMIKYNKQIIEMSDINYDIDVYFIKNQIESFDTMTVYLQLFIFHDGKFALHNDIKRNVESISNINTEHGRKFRAILNQKLKLNENDISNIEIDKINVSSYIKTVVMKMKIK